MAKHDIHGLSIVIDLKSNSVFLFTVKMIIKTTLNLKHETILSNFCRNITPLFLTTPVLFIPTYKTYQSRVRKTV